jgi:hypothetical protein
MVKYLQEKLSKRLNAKKTNYGPFFKIPLSEDII